MNPGRRPPRLARLLLELALPPEVRESVCGDLEEVFRRRRQALRIEPSEAMKDIG